MDTLKGWRTYIVSLALAVTGVMQSWDWVHIWPQGSAWVIAAIGAVMAGLRSITDTPPGQK